MPISAARRIAYDVLTRVETQQAYASDLLHTALTEKISAADAGLATELALGVLRQQRLLDFLIERQSRKRIVVPGSRSGSGAAARSLSAAVSRSRSCACGDF